MAKPEIQEMDDVLTYRLFRAGRLLRRHLLKFMDAEYASFTPEKFFLLYRLYGVGAMTQRQLADRALNDHPNITRLVEKLEEQGLVKRERDEDDRRNYNVAITGKGRELAKKIMPLVLRERKKLLAGISGEEMETVQKVLARIEKNMTE